ncbi:MAG: ATP-binding protein [Planctomycetaceae bacterium]|nr:ATP-binding protein [Planctomycetaceae bacterium]
MSNSKSFSVGMDFKHVHKTISEHVYETPLAFLRENVQNALDAIRMQAHADGKDSSDPSYEISIVVTPDECVIRDNGIGMSADDLRVYFWTIGASGKRTEEAKAAGCVGMFGIGGFANFGICDVLTVTSRKNGESTGTLTRLSQNDIDSATNELPTVHAEDSAEADPRGTIVSGHFKKQVNPEELKSYIVSFVRYAREKVSFNDNGVISQKDYFDDDANDGLVAIDDAPRHWKSGDLSLGIQFYRTQNHAALVAKVSSLKLGEESVRFQARLRLEGGSLDVLKRGFKLCATSISTQIGISGRVDCDRMTPTAGRDSLNSESINLLQRVAALVEEVGVTHILASRELLAQHVRIYRYVAQKGWIEKLGLADVNMADGSISQLDSIRTRAAQGVGVFFGAHQKQALSQIMQARGNIVVLLQGDRHRQSALQAYLTSYCKAKPFTGIVEFQEKYTGLDRFERVFISELEMTINSEFDIRDVEITAGKLTEDIPVYLSEDRLTRPLRISVDVRHAEVAKLRKLDFGPLLYSLIGTFCREYLGTILRKQSPKFFGSGAINLDSLEKKRSELWVLVSNDIHTVSRTSKRQIVRSSDVHTINAGGSGGGSSSTPASEPLVKNPKLLRIQGDEEFADILGYYIRIPDSASAAFGDVIKQYDNRGVVWAGNKILFVASDGISSAFQFEIRLEHVISSDTEGLNNIEGAEQAERSVQDLNGGLYFPLPPALENVLVPKGAEEIRIEVSSGDWIDTRNSHSWRAKETA